MPSSHTTSDSACHTAQTAYAKIAPERHLVGVEISRDAVGRTRGTIRLGADANSLCQSAFLSPSKLAWTTGIITNMCQ